MFIKKRGLDRGVKRGDLWGKRIEKYRSLAQSSIKSINLKPLQVVQPDWPFIFQDLGLKEIYDTGWSVQDIFVVNSVGIVTARDEFTLCIEAEDLWKRIKDVSKSEPEDIRSRYKLGKDTRDWTAQGAIADLRAEPIHRTSVKPVHYRPFDSRYTYFTGRSRGFLSYPRTAIWRLLDGSNIGLVMSRFTKGETFAHAFVTDTMIEKIVLSPNTSNNGFLFPLRLSSDIENLSPAFRAYADTHYAPHHYDAEQILGYIYAILHAPTYRRRYAEFLRIDFPRIPFAESADDFDALSQLGHDLIQAHLLKDFPRRGLADYHGKGDNSVDTPRYVEAERRVFINEAQSFAPVPKEVWEFHIGGYQVLDKYLKSRKGRKLSLDEINHVSAVADVLAFTITQMARIDAAWTAAFPDRG